MKKSLLLPIVIISGGLLLGFSGCAKEEEEDLTKWPIPKFEREVVETEKAPEMEEEEELSIIKSREDTYVVKKGDSISVIASKHGVSPMRLAEANGLELEGPKSIIYPGQKLIIPGVNKSVYYYEK